MVHLTSEDVGRYFVDENGDVWQCVSYADQPTATLMRVKDGDRVGGVCGAPIFRPFTRLKKESPDGR